jgi:hypothetical protein
MPPPLYRIPFPWVLTGWPEPEFLVGEAQDDVIECKQSVRTQKFPRSPFLLDYRPRDRHRSLLQLHGHVVQSR